MELLTNLLCELEQLRGSRAMLFATNEVANPARHIMEKDVLAFYDCLHSIDEAQQIDLVLHTGGGEVQAARKVIELLRMKAQRVCVLVPYKARSAGTLMCLGADEVVMTPMAELSPIDPQIAMNGTFAGKGPKTLSAEDIRCFREMAQTWFGVEGSGVEMLGLLVKNIFPTTLTDFYRANQFVYEVAERLFAKQRPNLSSEQRRTSIEQLMHGFHSHRAYLNRHDAAEAGMAVVAASDAEEVLLWQLYQELRGVFAETAVAHAKPNGSQPPIKKATDALLVTANTALAHVVQTVEYIQSGGNGAPMRVTMSASWQEQADAVLSPSKV